VADHPCLDRGAFTLSLDLELIWGTLDLLGPDAFRRRCEVEREIVIDRLLDLFVEFDVSATWCVVGHLLLDKCYRENGCKHPEIVRPRHAWCRGDWFEHDADGTEAEASTFLGRSLVEKIRSCPVPQEIGAHSFSHVIFGDVGCSRETARSEIEACVRLGAELGLSLRSFSFPRNQVGHLELLGRHGFVCFRGPEPDWYRVRAIPAAVQRLAHLFDVLTLAAPPVVLPRPTSDGVIDIPGSMVYFPAHGFRRGIPVSWRVRRALKGLDAAVREQRVFHLWAHPTNLADRTEAMFGGLRQILERVSKLRAAGSLDVMTMAGLASRATTAAEVRLR
jgi:peptidoglycan/xylan/chitin deacetylase (PgdA/CDA1 family)